MARSSLSINPQSDAAKTPGYILVAEDNPADVFFVHEALENLGLDCGMRVVSDGDQAVQFIDALDHNFASRCPELLLLDLHLPRVDGDEILRHWRQSERCGGLPVIVFTASDNPLDIQTAARHAANYFRKPMTLDEIMQLGNLVKTMIEGAKFMAEGAE